jgi:predicted SAM-dependent methyltransferase
MGVDMHGDAADIKMDILELTLPENCADEIYASHLIEHLPQHRAPELLTKWHKTLKHGGKIVMETPDLRWLVQGFTLSKAARTRRQQRCAYLALM